VSEREGAREREAEKERERQRERGRERERYRDRRESVKYVCGECVCACVHLTKTHLHSEDPCPFKWAHLRHNALVFSGCNLQRCIPGEHFVQ